MFVHEHLRFREVALKCDIVGKEDNYKYLHCTRITLGNDLLFLFVNFFFASLFLRNLWQEAQVFIHLATSCEYDNVEVKEKSVMCHASQIIAGKDVGVLLFYFFTFKSFAVSIFDM